MRHHAWVAIMLIAALCAGLSRYRCMFPNISFIVHSIKATPNSDHAFQELAE